jgi:hypothetical protein
MVPSLIKGYKKTIARFLGKAQSDLPNVHLGKNILKNKVKARHLSGEF